MLWKLLEKETVHFMEYSTVYEASPRQFLTAPLVIAAVLEVLLLVYAVVNWKNSAKAGKIGMCVVGGFLSVIFLVTTAGHWSSQSIWREYQKGEYQIAEGTIENYEVGSEEKASFPDRFTVNDTEFIIAEQPAFGYGYALRQNDGGALRNGLKCKIFYVPYKYENVIMKIMLFDEG